jgi:hypothetical protein
MTSQDHDSIRVELTLPGKAVAMLGCMLDVGSSRGEITGPEEKKTGHPKVLEGVGGSTQRAETGSEAGGCCLLMVTFKALQRDETGCICVNRAGNLHRLIDRSGLLLQT